MHFSDKVPKNRRCRIFRRNTVVFCTGADIALLDGECNSQIVVVTDTDVAQGSRSF